MGDLGAVDDSLTAPGDAGRGVGDLGAADDSLTAAAGETGPGVGDMSFPAGEEAASDAGGGD